MHSFQKPYLLLMKPTCLCKFCPCFWSNACSTRCRCSSTHECRVQAQSASCYVCNQSTGKSTVWKKQILFKTLAFNDWKC